MIDYLTLVVNDTSGYRTSIDAVQQNVTFIKLASATLLKKHFKAVKVVELYSNKSNHTDISYLLCKL